MNLYTSAYMSGLNQHLPFLHLPSLDLNQMDMALLLTICSIGALYCFEKELARKLHEAASVFLAEVIPSPQTPFFSLSATSTVLLSSFNYFDLFSRIVFALRSVVNGRFLTRKLWMMNYPHQHCRQYYYVYYLLHGAVMQVS